MRNGSKITPLINAELDLDHRDDDVGQIQNLTEQLSHNNPTKESLADFQSVVMTAYRNGGLDEVQKATALINQSLEAKKAGSKSSTIEVGTIEDKANGTTTVICQLRNAENGQTKELSQNHFNAKREVMDGIDFIADKLKDGDITPLEQSLIDNVVQKAPETERMMLGPGYFIRPQAFRDKYMEQISERLKELKEADPKMDELTLVKDGANYQLRNLTKEESKALVLNPIKGLNPDLKTADWYAERLSSGELKPEVLEQLNSTFVDVQSRYGPDEVREMKNLINIMLRKPLVEQADKESGQQSNKLRASSPWMLKDGVIPAENAADKEAPKVIYVLDLYNSQTKEIKKDIVKIESHDRIACA